MKNFEKFKTPEEAYSTWEKYCNARQLCRKCKYSNLRKNTTINCVLGGFMMMLTKHHNGKTI